VSEAQRILPRTERAEVLANNRLAEGVGLLVLHAPYVALHVRPGQFIHLRVTDEVDPLLRRPFSVHRVSAQRIEILYQVLGRGTRVLSLVETGDTLDLIGPLGTGWSIPEDMSHALLVAGGLGVAPLGFLAEALAERGVAAVAAYGAPTAERLAGRVPLEVSVRKIEVATDDGSEGERGFVTALSERLLAEEHFDRVYVCGPEAVERIVSMQAREAGVPCEVSLERLMACGVGACLSCVVRTTEGVRRACVDGPVFDASVLLWDSDESALEHGTMR